MKKNDCDTMQEEKRRYPEMGQNKKVIKILWVKTQMHIKYNFKMDFSENKAAVKQGPLLYPSCRQGN